MSEKTDYQTKIKDYLNKVVKGEPVFSKPVENTEKTLDDKIKEKGVINVIKGVFNENHIPEYTNKDALEIKDSPYIKVSPPSSFKDVDDYWHNLEHKLSKIGIKNNKFDTSGELNLTINDIPIKFTIVRDSSNHDKPTIMIETNVSPDELFSTIEKSGLKVDRLSAKLYDKYLFVDIIP